MASAFFGGALSLFKCFHGLRRNIYLFQIFLMTSTLRRIDTLRRWTMHVNSVIAQSTPTMTSTVKRGHWRTGEQGIKENVRDLIHHETTGCEKNGVSCAQLRRARAEFKRGCQVSLRKIKREQQCRKRCS